MSYWLRILVLVFLALPLACASLCPPHVSSRNESVVVLHGLGRSSSSMRRMARFLEYSGFSVVNIDYPSRKLSIAELIEHLERELAKVEFGHPERVHFVGHSSGGILARAFLAMHPEFPVGRVVLLSPPNQGSQLAAELKDYAAFHYATGPLGQELAKSPTSVPTGLPGPSYPLGVIAGDRSVVPPFSWLIPGKDDGIVGVEEAKDEGMADFLVVHRAHTWIMNSREVQA